MSEIGANIAALRKQKGITQENLADIVGITAQAVSKWESGGSPDTALLPVIADYFGVSIDSLFGRRGNVSNMRDEVLHYIASFPAEERLHRAFDLCLYIPLAVSNMPDEVNMGYDEMVKIIEDVRRKQPTDALYISDDGLGLVGLQRAVRFFLLMPEPDEGWGTHIHYREECSRLFAMLADENALHAMFFLHSRENKHFTAQLLERELDIPAQRVSEILEMFAEFGLVTAKELEMNDAFVTFYEFKPEITILPLLIFAERFCNRQKMYFSNIQMRKKPFLSTSRGDK